MITDEERRTRLLRQAYWAIDKATVAYSNEPEYGELADMREQLNYWLTTRGIRP